LWISNKFWLTRIPPPTGEDWDRTKENLADDFENAPENASRWTGEQVGRVENFGDDVNQKWDDGVQNVEDFPEDAARWTGDKVQAVEDIPDDIENKWDNMTEGVDRFGDNMADAYDDGRDERRYEDEDDY
jgi:hypothetical protein